MQYKQSICFENQIPAGDPLRQTKLLADLVLNQMHLETHFDNKNFPPQHDQLLKAHFLMSILKIETVQEFLRILKTNNSLRWFLDLGADQDFSNLNWDQLNLKRATQFIRHLRAQLAMRKLNGNLQVQI